MRRSHLLLASAAAASLIACDQPATLPPAPTMPPAAVDKGALPANHPPVDNKGPQALAPIAGAPTAMAAPEGGITGTVAETLAAPGYTYVKLTTATGEVWAAGPTTAVVVGQRVTIVRPTTMANFESKTLGRTFASIEFAEAIVPADGAAPTAAPAAPTAGTPVPAIAGGSPNTAVAAVVTDVKVDRAPGGKTVAEIWGGKDGLKGQKVKLHATVVKASNGILGKNWLHVRDGSGVEGKDNDLVVTTLATAGVGDVVTVEGLVGTDRDLGAGYKYAVLIEDAAVTK